MTDQYRIAYKGEQAQLYLAKTNPGWTWVDAPDMAHRFDCWDCRIAMDIALDVLVTNYGKRPDGWRAMVHRLERRKTR